MPVLRRFVRVALLGTLCYVALLAFSTWVTHLNSVHAVQ